MGLPVLRPRVIPALLLDQGKLVKTVKFGSPIYVGDPVNAVRIFNEKEVDELILVDISATRRGQSPDFDLVEELASEAFMPISYAGGVRKLADFHRLFSIGVEKVVVNTAAVRTPALVGAAAAEFGGQSVGVALDVRSGGWRRRPGGVFGHAERRIVSMDVVAYAKRQVAMGAGEVFLTSVDREGTRTGLDLELVRSVARAVAVPVIAHGGVGSVDHIVEGLEAGAAAVACGSLFVLRGPHRAVLISYLEAEDQQRVSGQGRRP